MTRPDNHQVPNLCPAVLPPGNPLLTGQTLSRAGRNQPPHMALFACRLDRSWGHFAICALETLVSRRPRRHGTLLFAHHCLDGIAQLPSSQAGDGDATLPARGNRQARGGGGSEMVTACTLVRYGAGYLRAGQGSLSGPRPARGDSPLTKSG